MHSDELFILEVAIQREQKLQLTDTVATLRVILLTCVRTCYTECKMQLNIDIALLPKMADSAHVFFRAETMPAQSLHLLHDQSIVRRIKDCMLLEEAAAHQNKPYARA